MIQAPTTNGLFSGGTAQLGYLDATVVPANWFNAVTQELDAILTAAGNTPDNTGADVAQVLQSLQSLFASQPVLTAETAAREAADTTLQAEFANYAPLSAFGFDAAPNGYQKLPGGCILQWGTGQTPTGHADIITFPIAFGGAVLFCGAFEGQVLGWGTPPDATIFGTQLLNNLGFQLSAVSLGGGSPAYVSNVTYRFLAIGY